MSCCVVANSTTEGLREEEETRASPEEINKEQKGEVGDPTGTSRMRGSNRAKKKDKFESLLSTTASQSVLYKCLHNA